MKIRPVLSSVAVLAVAIACGDRPAPRELAESAEGGQGQSAPTEYTRRANQAVAAALPLDDPIDFENADRGLLAREPELRIEALDIAELDQVKILENGKHAGTRDFYCGPLDELVVVRYAPAAMQEGVAEIKGQLVAIDFIGSQP